MKRFEYPRINEDATPEVQLKEIRLFLKRLIDELNSGRENVTALSVFNEALAALREAELYEQSGQGSPASKQLGAVAVELVNEAVNSKMSYFNSDFKEV